MSWINNLIISIGAAFASLFGVNHTIINIPVQPTSTPVTTIVSSPLNKPDAPVPVQQIINSIVGSQSDADSVLLEARDNDLKSTVKTGSEFVVNDPFPEQDQSMVSGIRLKLVGIKTDSVTVDVLADVSPTDKSVSVVRLPMEQIDLSWNSCINAESGIADVAFEYCFSAEKQYGQTILVYYLQEYGTMPLVTNQYSNTNIKSTSTTTNDGDLHTYTNNDYGFSISYPLTVSSNDPIAVHHTSGEGSNMVSYNSFEISPHLYLYVASDDSYNHYFPELSGDVESTFIYLPAQDKYPGNTKADPIWGDPNIYPSSFSTSTSLFGLVSNNLESIDYDLAYYSLGNPPCVSNPALLVYEHDSSDKSLSHDIFTEIEKMFTVTASSKLRSHCNIPSGII
jgi:hypothetical protein